MTVQTPTCSPRAAQRKANCTQHSHGWAMLVFVFFLTDPRRIWATTNARLRNQNNYQHFLFLADIQECYEVTLQLNKEQAVVKDDSRADVWEVTFFFYLLSFFKLLSIQYASAPPCCIAEFILLLSVFTTPRWQLRTSAPPELFISPSQASLSLGCDHTA